MKLEQNVLLKDLTTFRTGGPARFLVRVRNVEDLKEAADLVKKEKLPFFVLGGGANVLFPDEGYDGLVLKMEIGGMEFVEKENDITRVVAGAGEIWDDLVKETVERGLIGLENMTLVPGTVGAAPVQNIGCYGSEIKETCAFVEAFDPETLEIRIFPNEECKFTYRDSFFKTEEGKKYIVTRVAFDLSKNAPLKTEYRDVKEYLAKNNITSPSQKNIRAALVEIRTNKLPDLREYGCAGSFFKNPVVSIDFAEEFLKKYPEITVYPLKEGFVKLPVGWILDHICNLRGIRHGHVGAYKNQALVVVNHGGATTKEILEFAEFLQDEVKKKTNIDIEPELQIVK